jgi:hypothetical protein
MKIFLARQPIFNKHKMASPMNPCIVPSLNSSHLNTDDRSTASLLTNTFFSRGSTKRLLNELMAPDKPYSETNSKGGLLESGRRPAKWPFIQWRYALTTIGGELASTSGLPKYWFLLCGRLYCWISADPHKGKISFAIDDFGSLPDDRYYLLCI